MNKMKLIEEAIIIVIVYAALSFVIALAAEMSFIYNYNDNRNTMFALAFVQIQSNIQNSTTISRTNNGTVIDYTCYSVGMINYTGIIVHCPPYPKTGTNCHLVNDGTPHPQFYDNCTPFFNHQQTNNYYNGYINGSQEGLNQGFNAIRDPSDYCTGLDPHDNFCKGWSQGYEDAWQYEKNSRHQYDRYD